MKLKRQIRKIPTLKRGKERLARAFNDDAMLIKELTSPQAPTPVPWMTHKETEEGRSYIAQESGPVYVARSVTDADAAFIVRAVNTHAGLVDALVGMLTAYAPRHDSFPESSLHSTVIAARRALRAAGENY